MLIVEDEPDLRECLTDFFIGRGFSVDKAFSGEEALQSLEAQAADVILLDILLPGMSGMEVLRRAKALHPKARFIMVTAVDQADVRARAERLGAAAYITKPFDFTDATWFPVFSPA